MCFERLFEGAVPVTGGGGESQQRRSPSLIGQPFARSSPTLVAAQKACERAVYEISSRTNGSRVTCEGSEFFDSLTGKTFARYYTFSQEVLAAWGYSKERLLEGANPIALLKAATVLVVAPVLFEVLPNRSYVWFIDNTVGLHKP
jgi:hypothetical protein